MNPVGPAPARTRPLVVHVSNPQIGGAEASLLADVAEASAGTGLKPLFLVPSEGPLAAEVRSRGWDASVIAWPGGMERLSQKNWRGLPLILPGLVPYLFRLHAAFKQGETVRSSGFKSHCACILLARWHGPRILFDIRDFLRPRFMRAWIARIAVRFGCRIAANSRAVGADYPGAGVRYPLVATHRPPVDRRAPGGKIIVTHLAYFAPYKGQDLFLACARKLIDAGIDAEFWMIGDVIYPAEIYDRYREKVYEVASRLRLSPHVRFLGKVRGGEEVQRLLEQTHLLLHCTREPEPFGRAVMEALLCGSEAVCHGGSGVCEVAETSEAFPAWMSPLREVLGPEYVRVTLRR